MLLMPHKGGLGRRPPSHRVGSAVTAGSWGDTTHHCHRASEPAQPRGHGEAIGTSLTVAAERGHTRGPVPPGGPDLDLSPCGRPTPACRVRTWSPVSPCAVPSLMAGCPQPCGRSFPSAGRLPPERPEPEHQLLGLAPFPRDREAVRARTRVAPCAEASRAGCGEGGHASWAGPQRLTGGPGGWRLSWWPQL